jgi:hypothetical protein
MAHPTLSRRNRSQQLVRIPMMSLHYRSVNDTRFGALARKRLERVEVR